MLEAEAYDGPALIIAYSHCIAHGIDMTSAMQNQKAAVLSGQWLLYRYNPDLAARGENPLHLDSAAPKLPVADYLNLENRFKMLSEREMEEWMEAQGYDSVEELKGRMNQKNCPDPAAFERAQYLRGLSTSWRTMPDL
jgi:pyruvate/2-oxoacid:ferredoxin oxidoreductase beta subunit